MECESEMTAETRRLVVFMLFTRLVENSVMQLDKFHKIFWKSQIINIRFK